MALYFTPDTTSSNYMVATSDSTVPWVASWWVNDTQAKHYISYSDSGSIAVIGGSLQVGDRTNYVSWPCGNVSGWSHFTAERLDDTISAWQDGTSLVGGGSLPTVDWSGQVTCFRGTHDSFDLRIMDCTHDSSAWAYYRSDVLSGGDRVLPA